MDMNRILQMIWQQFGGKLMNIALKKGAYHLDRRAQMGKTGEASLAQRAQKDSARQTVQRMKQIRSVTRRFF